VRDHCQELVFDAVSVFRVEAVRSAALKKATVGLSTNFSFNARLKPLVCAFAQHIAMLIEI